jgi:predicted regulator of Ras-like GTPase activity (Roadblock/LC7/MglB family)
MDFRLRQKFLKTRSRMPIALRMEKVKAAADTSWMASGMPPLPPTSSPPSPGPWTAPGQPMPAPMSAATPAPSSTATDPTAILDELIDQVDGVRSAILASVDGFGLARSTSMTDEASHPAMLAAAIGLAHQLVVMGGGTQLRQFVVDHDGGLLLVWPIGDQRVLAVLAATGVEQRRVRSFVQSHAVWLAGAQP